jgi:hypothetical protein
MGEVFIPSTTWTVVKDSVNGDNEDVSVLMEFNEALCSTLADGVLLVSELCCLRPPVDTPRLPDFLGASAKSADSLLFWDFLEDTSEEPSDLWGDSVESAEFLLIWDFLEDSAEGLSDLWEGSMWNAESLLF